jgi:hypothetical protein
MSMYNLVHGENPLAVILLACVRTHREGIARYRDAFLNADGTKVHVLARIGGGNREGFQFAWDAIRNHPLYLSDKDDAFDSTYAWITFNVDEAYLPSTKPLATGKEPPSLRELTHDVLCNPQRVQQLLHDPRIRELMTKIMQTLAVKEKV